jgi:hypothetical protein
MLSFFVALAASATSLKYGDSSPVVPPIPSQEELEQVASMAFFVFPAAAIERGGVGDITVTENDNGTVTVKTTVDGRKYKLTYDPDSGNMKIKVGRLSFTLQCDRESGTCSIVDAFGNEVCAISFNSEGSAIGSCEYFGNSFEIQVRFLRESNNAICIKIDGVENCPSLDLRLNEQDRDIVIGILRELFPQFFSDFYYTAHSQSWNPALR